MRHSNNVMHHRLVTLDQYFFTLARLHMAMHEQCVHNANFSNIKINRPIHDGSLVGKAIVSFYLLIYK